MSSEEVRKSLEIEHGKLFQIYMNPIMAGIVTEVQFQELTEDRTRAICDEWKKYSNNEINPEYNPDADPLVIAEELVQEKILFKKEGKYVRSRFCVTVYKLMRKYASLIIKDEMISDSTKEYTNKVSAIWKRDYDPLINTT